MKAIVIYNDFDRDYFEGIVVVARSLKSQATDLHDFIQNEWNYNGTKDGHKQMIRSEINSFLDKFLKGTNEDYKIDEFKLHEVQKATGYLNFIIDTYDSKVKERVHIDIITPSKK
jgi:hypothetical protein